MRRSEAQENLRRQLLEVFPTWEGSEREDQRIILHIGQTNSGKTYHGLNNLIRAGSGWYLSPLRLLAHEVYDTLNRRGVLCSLLTGEEAIPVDGARITAATIEMFNPNRSGACVIIDEAHMLADEQRGWAWTRALMETASPEIHVVGSPVAEDLVNRLAEQLGLSRSTPTNTNAWRRWTPPKVRGVLAKAPGAHHPGGLFAPHGAGPESRPGKITPPFRFGGVWQPAARSAPAPGRTLCQPATPRSAWRPTRSAWA